MKNDKMHGVRAITKASLFFVFIAFLISSLVSSDAVAGRLIKGVVVKVSDGDTIQIMTPEQTKLKVRLYGIDAPETSKPNRPGQPFGEESTEALKRKLFGKCVTIDLVDVDKYRRLVCVVFQDGRNINIEMVREGFAEAFIEYLKKPFQDEFLEAEYKAKAERRGIWSLPDYERPRNFRKRYFN